MGVNLARLLESKGVSQTQLAAELKVSFQTVNGYVNGRAGVSAAMIENIAKVLSVEETALTSDPALLQPPTTPQLQKTGPKMVPDSRLTLIGGIVAALTPLNKEKLALVLRFATRLAGGVGQDQDVSDRVQGDK